MAVVPVRAGSEREGGALEMDVGCLEQASDRRRLARVRHASVLFLVFLCLGLPAAAAQGPRWGIGIEGDPAPLVVGRAEPGREPDPVQDESTLLSYEAHPARWPSYRIRARLDRPLPPGVTLEVRLGSGEFKSLPAPPAEPVTLLDGIPRKARDTLPIAYRLSAAVSVAAVGLYVRQVTFYWEEESE